MSEAAKTDEPAVAGRRLTRSTTDGILSTMSSELPGYPFGSVTPYVLTHEGRPVVYVSEIAQHTRNMRADAKVCLTVTDQGDGANRQALGRVTLVGDAREVPERERGSVAARYFAFHPEAEAYAGTHAFRFFWIEPVRVRFIGGFGNIHWVEPEDWLVPTPDWREQERGIVDHMNADHADALANIARRASGVLAEGAVLVALDPEGLHVRTDSALLYVPFASACATTDEVRAATIELARAAAATD